MDTAVALVQAYLRVNGYFTVSEYPVVERLRAGGIRTMTDLDILGFRFPGAGHALAREPEQGGLQRFGTDPVLGASAEWADMLIGEVKEGAAVLNRAGRDPRVLEVVLTRFGCCPASEAAATAERLIKTGATGAAGGHLIRLVAFGAASAPQKRDGYMVIPLAHVVDYLRLHLRNNWNVLRHVQPGDPVFGFLSLLEKVRHTSGED